MIAYSKGSRDPNAVDKWTIFFDPAINTELKQHASGATFIDPMRICEGSLCPYRAKGDYLYEDAEHFSVKGSDAAVAAYFPLLGNPPLDGPALSASDPLKQVSVTPN